MNDLAPTDTSPPARAAVLELLRQAGFEKRLAMALSLTETVRGLSLQALGRKFPHASRRELLHRLGEHVYGREVMSKALAQVSRPES